MTIKKFHLTLPNQDKICALKYLENNNMQNTLKDNTSLLEIEFKFEEKDKLDLELITEEVTNLITHILKHKLLKEYVFEQYKEIYRGEEERIYSYSLGVFEQKEVFIKSSIYKKIHNYILNNNYLNIEGFVNFRIKELTDYISTIGDIAVEEYIIKKDQDEFINVLKYFIEIQDEKIDLLRIHILEDNSFVLYDKDGKKIDDIDNEDIINMIIKENMNYEDFLISTLLTLCPGKIEILDTSNKNSSKEIINTIKSIFDDKVELVYPN